MNYIKVYWDRIICAIIGHNLGLDYIYYPKGRKRGVECRRCGIARHRNWNDQWLAWHYEDD